MPTYTENVVDFVWFGSSSGVSFPLVSVYRGYPCGCIGPFLSHRWCRAILTTPKQRRSPALLSIRLLITIYSVRKGIANGDI